MSADDLQARLDGLERGGVLTLHPPRHEFHGPIVIRKAAIIEGQGATIWAAQGPVITIEASGVVLRNVNVEVTSRDAALSAERSCALVVSPGRTITLANVSVCGNVMGLEREGGHWSCPRMLALGTLQANVAHEFRVLLAVPVACAIESEIDNLHAQPRTLQGNPVEAVLRLDPLPAGTRLRGLLKLKTASLTRQVSVSGTVGTGSAIHGTGQLLWQPEGGALPLPAASRVTAGTTAPLPVPSRMTAPATGPNTTPPSPPLMVPPAPSSLPVGAAVIVVSQFGDGQFRTIGEAVQSASTGARILVRSGVYREAVVLDKRVELVGDGPVAEVVVESLDTNCLRSQAEIAKVRGLTFRGAAGRGRDRSAVHILHGRLILEDCDITAASLACVAVHGATATPSLRRCRIHGGASSGVLVYDRAEPELDDCDIFDHALAGVEIRQGGNPALHRCKVHGGRGPGVLVHATGRGMLQECEVFDNALANIEVRQAGEPALRRCQVHGGAGPGIRVHHQGRGTFEDCEVRGCTLVGVQVTDAAAPVFRRCTVRDGKQAGVLVAKNGQGLFEGCTISGHAQAGVEVRQGGAPTFRQSKVHDNRQAGILAAEKGIGTFEECEVFDNGGCGVAVVGEASPVLRRCHVHNNKLAGIAWQRGAGTAEKCKVAGNGLAGLALAAGAKPVVRHCTITDNGDTALWATLDSSGDVAECDLTNNRNGDVDLHKSARVRLDRNTMDSA